jgi:TP901 family phage tail tape measure protein
MIAGFEVGALFKLVDEMSPGLRKILESMRELNASIKTARESMVGFSGAVGGGLAGAIGEVNDLTAAWERVAVASRGAAAAASGGAAAAVGGAAAAVGGGGGFRPGIGGGGGGGPHITGGSMALPGLPGHMHLGGTPAMVGAGAAGYALFEGSGMETAVGGLKFHLGISKADTSHDDQIKQIIEGGMVSTGKDMSEVVAAATDMARIMRDTPGFDAMKELPRFLRAALTESLSKGTSLDESMKSIVGIAHMVKAYKPGEMERLFQTFAYLSTANPAGLPSMEKTFSYAVPILQSGADIDPKDVMILSTILGTSGVTASKGGTWVREMAVRMLPGNDKHNAMLRQLGLLDENGKPTWFTDGKPDLPKALSIAGPRAAAMPPEVRLPLEMEVFGRRGGGGFAVLGNDIAIGREKELRAGMDNPGNIARYNAFADAIMETTRGVARSSLQEFNVAMIELGTKGLPLATASLHAFTAALGWFTGGHSVHEDKTFKPNWMEHLHDWMQPLGPLGRGASQLPRPQNQSFLSGPPKQPTTTPISFSLNVDGQTLAQTMSTLLQDMYTFANGAPAGDASQMYVEPHDNRVRT